MESACPAGESRSARPYLFSSGVTDTATYGKNIRSAGHGPAGARATLLLLDNRRCSFVIHYIAEFNARFALVVLIVLIADDQLDPLRKIPEVQRIVGVSVRGKPILAVDLLAIGGKTRELVVLAVPDGAHAFAVGLDNLQVAIVHPSLAFKVALTLHRLLRFRSHGKNIGIDLVDLFAADISNVVVGNLVGGEHERLHVNQVGQILGRQE